MQDTSLNVGKEEGNAGRKTKRSAVKILAVCTAVFVLLLGLFGLLLKDYWPGAEPWRENVLIENADDALFRRLNVNSSRVRSITFLDTKEDAPELTSYDLSEAGDNSVIGWTEGDSSQYVDVYIAGDGGVNGRNTANLFRGLKNLKEIRFNDCFHTDEATSMRQMFLNCASIETLDLSGLNTSNVTDMYAMFQGCYDLKTLNLHGIDTSNVTTMKNMFCECNSLRVLDLRSFDTSKVKDMSNMFSSCFALETASVSSFDTSYVENMSGMFSWCQSLSDVDVSGFNTENVKYMNCMFRGCWNLESLDVTGFDISNVELYECFMGSGKLINGQPWEDFFK